LAPQYIKVKIEILETEGKDEKNVTISLATGESVTVFNWEDWVNSAMGFMKGMEDAMSNDEIEDGTKRWRKRTPRKVNLSGPIVTVPGPSEELPDLLGDIQVWTGWPFFDIKITQFEMNEWMRASGCLNGYCEVLESEEFHFDVEVENAEEGLMEMSEWPEAKWRSITEEMESVSEMV